MYSLHLKHPRESRFLELTDCNFSNRMKLSFGNFQDIPTNWVMLSNLKIKSHYYSKAKVGGQAQPMTGCGWADEGSPPPGGAGRAHSSGRGPGHQSTPGDGGFRTWGHTAEHPQEGERRQEQMVPGPHVSEPGILIQSEPGLVSPLHFSGVGSCLGHVAPEHSVGLRSCLLQFITLDL